MSDKNPYAPPISNPPEPPPDPVPIDLDPVDRRKIEDLIRESRNLYLVVFLSIICIPLAGLFIPVWYLLHLRQWDIEIIAEINHAPRKTLPDILAMAESMRTDGANLIDVGCEPNSCWQGVGDCVKALRDAGHRVSIDSLNPVEILAAVEAGAELVLSVNESNREFAADWGCEVVVIPDDIQNIDSMDATIEILVGQDVPVRLDPILEPIGFGFANSIKRYLDAREKWPDAPMMMGIGNITELTDVDSAGVNMLLLAICQELNITRCLLYTSPSPRDRG